MTGLEVRPVLSAGPPELMREIHAALASQALPTAPAVNGSRTQRETIRAALATGARWLWLLDGVTVPEPGALQAFADVLLHLGGLPEPLLLAGKVLDAGGEVHPDAAPRHEVFEKELTVAACERGLVHLRAAPSGSLLVRRDAFERFGEPRADLPPSWSAFEFTARVLRSWDDPGYLVPASAAVRRVPPRPAGRRNGGLRSRARLLTGPAWKPTERLWESFLVAEGVLTGARGRAPRA